MQLQRLVEGTAVTVDDLDDGAYLLVAATLPRDQSCVDAVTPAGLMALGLPATYPVQADGRPVEYATCQAIGARVRAEGLRGVWCTSAATRDGGGRELAWFPATARSQARPVWEEALPLGAWRRATGWADLGLTQQPDPA
jgi:hypothetical protein